jgi:nitroreductase
MDVKRAIDERRAYRALDPVEITDDLVRELATAARLAPSCFNNQPARFVFVRDPEGLERVHGALAEKNAWAKAGSMIVAVASRLDLDCAIAKREYFLFDTGLATAFLILRATELGLVAHPIAGYKEGKAKAALGIPGDMRLIALVIVGKHSNTIGPLLTDEQAEIEKARPERKTLGEIAFMDGYHE